MSQFSPATRSPLADPYGDNASRMEGSKANFTAALMTSETCMRKCSVTEASISLST